MLKYLPLVLLGFIGTVRAEDAETVANTNAVANAPTQTIVCIRHGEKPKRGLGQLTPRGLNRALALPDVLLARYGKPQYIFAPNPTEKVDGKPGYYYVRPLTTIEPTAIKCGLPVNTQFGYTEIKALENELNKTNYQNATIFVAWEHGLLDQFGKNMVKDNGGKVEDVPPWSNNEYDMIFVFQFTGEPGNRKFSFKVEQEGLNGLSDEFPQPHSK